MTAIKQEIKSDCIEHEYLEMLAKLPVHGYKQVKGSFAKGLGISESYLDAEVKKHKQVVEKGHELPYPIIEPWHCPIEPTALLNEIAHTINRFIVCQKEVVTAATLWIAMTWFIDAIHIAPLAVITAPEKRCGKSQLLYLFSQMVKRPIPASNITPSALFRSIDKWQPTLLIDEADTFMRGLINAGHTRASAFIIRSVGKEFTPTQFNVWGAKAIAGIGKLPDTMMDRAIVLELRRKRPQEQVERMRHAEPGLFEDITAKLARLTEDYSGQIRTAKPALPDALHDRAQDNWEPLIAIASLAGDEWQKRVYEAAAKISGDIEQSTSIGVELLTDIYNIVEAVPADRITSAELIEKLCQDPEKPWSTYNRGNPISPRQVASRLKSFGITSNTIRIGSATAKGYFFIDFADVFNRYLPANLPQA
tara:strand:- start:507 stop:1769 length:1263 start_codon:yes stop_codon:yes gene_type:complete